MIKVKVFWVYTQFYNLSRKFGENTLPAC